MNKVEYLFYSKPMSSPYLILYSSAMPNKVKRNCLIQEGVRRLRNTSRNTDWSVKADILSQFCNKMYVSGYPKKYRLEVIQAAVGCYNKQCERADQGVRPLHRGRNFQKEFRWKTKALSKTTWFRPNNSVGFIPATPGGLLAKEIQKVVPEESSRLGLRAKIVEKGGTSLKNELVKMDITGCFYT